MSTVTNYSKIVWISDIAQAVSGYQRLQAEQRKTEAGLNRVTAASGRSQKATSVATARMANAQQAGRNQHFASRSLVAGVQDRSRGVGNGRLDLSPTGRAMARFGTGAGAMGAQDVSFSRFLHARNMRGQRNTHRASVASANAFDATVADNAMIGSMGRSRSRFSPELNAWAAGEMRKKDSARESLRRKQIDRKDLDAEMARDRFGDKVRKQRAGGRFRRFAGGSEELFPGMSMGKAGGMVVATSGFMAIGKAIDSSVERSKEMVTANEKFQDSMTGYLSLGDNMDQMRRRTSEVFGTSIATGMDTEVIIPAKFDFESATANLDKDTKRKISDAGLLVTKTKGGDLGQNTLAVSKLIQNYGGSFKDGKGGIDVNRAVNTLATIESEGTINFAQLANEAPDVYPAWEAAGKSLAELGGVIQVATGKMGKNDSTLRQIRNLPARLLNAEKVLGLKLNGTTSDWLDQINVATAGMATNDRQQALKKVGGDEGMTLLLTLLNDVQGIRAAERKIDNTDPNSLFKLQVKRWGDSGYASSEVTKSIGQFRKNIPAMTAQEGNSLYNTEAYLATLGGIEYQNRDKPWVTRESMEKTAIREMGLDAVDGTVGNNRFAAVTHENVYASKLMAASGSGSKDDFKRRMFEAEQYRIRHAAAFDARDSDGSLFNEDDGKQIRDLYLNRGLLLNTKNLSEYHRMQNLGQAGEAEEYINRVGRDPDQMLSYLNNYERRNIEGLDTPQEEPGVMSKEMVDKFGAAVDKLATAAEQMAGEDRIAPKKQATTHGPKGRGGQ